MEVCSAPGSWDKKLVPKTRVMYDQRGPSELWLYKCGVTYPRQFAREFKCEDGKHVSDLILRRVGAEDVRESQRGWAVRAKGRLFRRCATSHKKPKCGYDLAGVLSSFLVHRGFNEWRMCDGRQIETGSAGQRGCPFLIRVGHAR